MHCAHQQGRVSGRRRPPGWVQLIERAVEVQQTVHGAYVHRNRQGLSESGHYQQFVTGVRSVQVQDGADLAAAEDVDPDDIGAAGPGWR